jgi:hypothetical protein
VVQATELLDPDPPSTMTEPERLELPFDVRNRWAYTVKGVLAPQECQSLIDLTEVSYPTQPSTVGQGGKGHAIRSVTTPSLGVTLGLRCPAVACSVEGTPRRRSRWTPASRRRGPTTATRAAASSTRLSW